MAAGTVLLAETDSTIDLISSQQGSSNELSFASIP